MHSSADGISFAPLGLRPAWGQQWWSPPQNDSGVAGKAAFAFNMFIKVLKGSIGEELLKEVMMAGFDQMFDSRSNFGDI